MDLYHTRPETWNFDRAKTARIDDRNLVHIVNMDQVTILDSSEFSRGSESKFQAACGISILRRTAAEIAAVAVYEMYPDVALLGGGETSTGFFYNFSFPHPIHAHLIEEKMRQVIREKRPIRTLEMMAFSAKELLKKEGHTVRAKEVEEGLVTVIQIGSFHDLAIGPHLKNTAELAAFHISVESLPEHGMRIVGWCHASKDGLKRFLKKLDNYTEHPLLGEKMGFWKGEIWLPQGLKFLQKLTHFLKGQWFDDALEIAGPTDGDRAAMHRSMNVPKVAEVFGLTLQVSFFGKPEREVISSLQSIGKTLTILGFDHSTVSLGRATDFLIEDGLSRKWSVVRLDRTQDGYYFTVNVVRILALLLEKNLQGWQDVENK